tara:strand:- start:542 stop:1150 length:609 start_codon:yes stop_codon:yes gene_type:complete
MPEVIGVEALRVIGSFAMTQTCFHDHRGEFAQAFAPTTMAMLKLDTPFKPVHSNVAWNPWARTWRGLHYQVGPFKENKLVMCLEGEAWDFILDLREGSPTYGKAEWVALKRPQMDEQKRRVYKSVFIPKGCAHGYLTRLPYTTMLYFTDERYAPHYSRTLCRSVLYDQLRDAGADVLLNVLRYDELEMSDKDREASAALPKL